MFLGYRKQTSFGVEVSHEELKAIASLVAPARTLGAFPTAGNNGLLPAAKGSFSTTVVGGLHALLKK